jgi:DNA-binding MarR family transcriptional regulator
MPRVRKRVVFLTDAFMQPRKLAFPGAADPWATRAVFAIRALAQRINDHANAWLAPYGLTAVKYNYLVVLYGAEGQAMALNDLAAYIHTTSGSVTGVIDALEKDAFVERARHPADRRSIIAKLTSKGKAAIEQAFPVHHRHIELLLSELTVADRRTLVGFLGKLADGIDAYDERNLAANEPAGPQPAQR